jgi:hypothetical protein
LNLRQTSFRKPWFNATCCRKSHWAALTPVTASLNSYWKTKCQQTLNAEIKTHAQWAFRSFAISEREEAVQAAIAYAFIAYSRLVDLQRADLGYATPLARFGVRQFRAGRLIGGRVNGRDVGSARGRLNGCVVEPLDDWKEALCETRHATPAEIAALRIDVSDWLKTLSPRY